MQRFVAIDSGKYATKVAVYNKESDSVKMFKFRTKIGDGFFADDALEKSTVIMEYDGKVYKVGNGAVEQADLVTSKMNDIHKLCVLTALAISASSNEVDDIHVAVGIPVKEWENVEKRVAYKKFILPEGEISVKLMQTSDTPPVEKKFRIASRHVYPESQGALFLTKVAPLASDTVAVLDIGNLNINCTCWTNKELDHESSLTDELGGNILISGLAQELSSEFSRCNENYVAKLLRGPKEERMLKPNRKNPEVEKRSKDLIDKFLLNHVKEIKRKCDAKHWSLDYMTLVFIGGTSDLLRDEIKKVFGNEAYIPRNPEFANVAGFLRVMCAKVLGKVIPLPNIDAGESVEK